MDISCRGSSVCIIYSKCEGMCRSHASRAAALGGKVGRDKNRLESLLDADCVLEMCCKGSNFILNSKFFCQHYIFVLPLDQ